MPEHRPNAGNSDTPSIGERRIYERPFTSRVIKDARGYGWTSAHFSFREGGRMAVVAGKGFPDLVMYRRNEETGKVEFVIAELKARPQDKPRPEQEKWLEAFDDAQFPTYLWRPDNWDEIESVLKHGPAASETSEATSPKFALRHRSDGRLPANFDEAIDSLIEAIDTDDMDSGDHAGLRRMDPCEPNVPIFWELISGRLMPPNPDIAKWGLIMHGIALMSHGAGSAHDSTTPIGRALYEGDGNSSVALYSDSRLTKLLSARGSMLHQLLARMFRMLGNKRCAFNWRNMAWFILNEGYNEESAEAARVEIARAYYRSKSYNARQSQE